MLEEIMRKGTRSLGTDVPSEREINRLAARSDEEFWLFEKMDEERRQRENYRSRLMEEHEVPEWAYSTPDANEGKSKGFEHDVSKITGKRRRKEVLYADTLSDLQWMKAVENGVDISKLSGRGKRKNHPLSENNGLIGTVSEPGNEDGEESSKFSVKGKRRDDLLSGANDSASNDAVSELESESREDTSKFSSKGKKNDQLPSESTELLHDSAADLDDENMPVASEDNSEDTYGSVPRRLKAESIEKPEYQGARRVGWNGHILTWNTHKKKRSSYIPSSSSDSRGPNFNGRGNGWS